MKRILVAPDGSEVSDRAIDYAAVMTKDANADLGWQAWGRRKRGAVSWKRRPEAGQPGELRGRRRAMTTSRQGAVRSFTGSGHESALYDPFARTNGELMRPELNSHFARV